MSKSELISIIIPLYNCEKYITTCLNSILHQTYKDFEVIVVDDGSKDSSLTLAKKFCKEDNRILVLSQQNYGVSRARNEGIKKAKGKYITFCDADDFLEPTHLECLVSSFNNTEGCELGIIGHLRYIEDQSEKIPISCSGDCPNRDDLIDRMLKREGRENQYLGYIWNKIFLRSIIISRSIQFNEEISYAEDWLFVLNYLRYIRIIVEIPELTYNYRVYKGDRLSYKGGISFNRELTIDTQLSQLYPERIGIDALNERIVYNWIKCQKFDARTLDLKHYLSTVIQTYYNNPTVISAVKHRNDKKSYLEYGIGEQKRLIFLSSSIVRFFPQIVMNYLGKYKRILSKYIYALKTRK